MEERLQKILARANYGSRRKCEALITDGRVTVNGQVAALGQKADPDADEIRVDGSTLRLEKLIYIILNKPRDILSDGADDRSDGPTARELVSVPGHLYPVGRLDLRSEGLLLLTNDGDLANLLTHPRYEHSKEYHVVVAGQPDIEALESWRKGVILDGKRTAPAEVTVLERSPKQTVLKVVLREGRKRQIRRVAASLGFPVRQLVRTRIGPIELGSLRSGEWRHLRSGEVKQLREIKEQRPARKRSLSSTRRTRSQGGRRKN
jgi:23S rRNA pseudouridine2605 synthase